ncbi:MAG: S41 family peptidase [Candidatus Wildermuthbacteria bacterium]|nr:S41 family peptidase [Candidatus Wildermuthbacteria bacterium]
MLGWQVGHHDVEIKWANYRPTISFTNKVPPSAINLDFKLFWDTWDLLSRAYFNKKALDPTKMFYGAISGMVAAVGEPYTVFLPPEQQKFSKDELNGRFEGVGIQLGFNKDKRLVVIAPLSGTPAEKAGIKPEDEIVKIEDKDTTNMTLPEAVNLIRGAKGTTVTLGILREGWQEVQDFGIQRAVIEVPSLKWEMKDGKVAHIILYQFSEKAGSDFRKAANQIIAQGASKIVLDLRDNPGGYLEISQDIAGWFLQNGQTVVVEDFRDGRERVVYTAEGRGAFAQHPVVVLINEGSASASEILAGALRDNRGIQLVGETSFGKGSVQELKSFRDDSSLKVTVARWLTPKGTLIADQGLKPDVEVERTDEDIDQDRDPQLEKALEILKSL